MTETPAALSLSGITKRFARVTALDGASLVVEPGTVHAVLGENGAGKTTLVRIAFGLLAPDAGQIAVRGRPVRFASAADAIAQGIGMVHQHFTNVGAMTVAENVALGGRGRLRERDTVDTLTAVGRRTGLTLDPTIRAEELPVGGQQRLEIVKALARDASILILDEPTAVLAPDEANDLLRWLRGFASGGGTVVIITHKLPEALGVADAVTVLRHGRTVMTSPAGATDAPTLALAMVGEDMRESAAPTSSPTTGVAVRVEGLTLTTARDIVAVRDASFGVRGGEIVGIAAVEGSGQRELVRALAGRIQARSGTIERPHDVGFVPEDRQRDALVLDLSVAENVALRGAGARRGRMRWRAQRPHVAALIADFDVRGTPETPVRHLSGGNQQKLVLARELESAPELLVVENPTRGLDIRATAAVHGYLRAAARRGAAVVVYSSDLDEVLSLASRMLVLHAGRVRETIVDRDVVARAMLGVE